MRGQFFRYLLSTRFAAAGLSTYASGPIADLLVACNADDDLRERLTRLRAQFKPADFSSLITEAHGICLHCHPLLSPQRVKEYAELVDDRFGKVFQESMADITNRDRFLGYLRSMVLHGLLLSLQDLVVIHGRGNERQVLGHSRLPIQFGERADDVLHVFESGDHGDGTTRVFLKHLDEAFASWRRGELADCPYAAEDALLDMLFEQPEARLAHWRTLDPRHPQSLPRIGRELTGTACVAQAHLQALGRVLFQEEAVGARHFSLYELHRDIRAIQTQLTTRIKRRPSAWELVSAAVSAAERGDPSVRKLTELLQAYGDLAGDIEGDSLAPPARLADQVYRLSAALCVDGCHACLHRPSPLMSDSQAAVAVSRDLLQRYREFVLEPLSIRVDSSEKLPTRAQVDGIVASHGSCRLLVVPTVYDDVGLWSRNSVSEAANLALRSGVWLATVSRELQASARHQESG